MWLRRRFCFDTLKTEDLIPTGELSDSRTRGLCAFALNIPTANGVESIVKNSEVKVLWEDGLHARPASKLAQLARQFQSNIQLRCNEKVASARSIIGILLLCAAMGASIQVEAAGEDEEQAIAAVQELFESGGK